MTWWEILAADTVIAFLEQAGVVNPGTRAYSIIKQIRDLCNQILGPGQHPTPPAV
jgi:hypothetical protein